MRVLVIVVTFNGMRWLERCLGSVYADADLYVFDNDSTDGSADYVEEHFPQAKLVRSAENLGFSKPNNLGFSYAIEKGYDYVYLLNQDAWLEEGSLKKLVEVADAHPEFGVLSPVQYQDGYKALDAQFSKLLPHSCAELLVSSRGEGEKAFGCVNGSRFANGNNVVSVKRVMAAHWLIPVSVIKRIGPFEEDLFPHWGQDDEWCFRLHFCGLKIGVVSEARAVHDRALRKEPLEKLVKRNYYVGSTVRLCDLARPLWASSLYVLVFTFVKTLKYFNPLPITYFGRLIRNYPKIRLYRHNLRDKLKIAFPLR